ncbi:MAG: hypothetical protein K8R31_04235 [Bacteroidales bacterium]|nr:hypothetical protein [Bacteroidales bacterium]
MEEKFKKSDDKTLNVNDKLTWEAPKLYCLDKGKTEGGTTIQTHEEFDESFS